MAEIDYQALRIEGVYRQNEAGQLMLRVKLAAGLLSVVQAATLARLGRTYGSGTLHLSTRGSVEFHDLRYEQLADLQRSMAAVGLFSRGACGGAVRGISCSTGFGRGFNSAQVLARRLLLHFSGNPHFEGLPKKFKIAVEADYQGSRHLIQDLAFVHVGEEEGGALYDVWTGGGLGREPQAAIRYRQRVPARELLTLAEAIVRVYRDNVQPPKRLKSLIGTRGEEEFRRLVAQELTRIEAVRFSDAYDKTLLPVSAAMVEQQLTVPVFAGEITAESLGRLAAAAAKTGIEYLQVTADQDLALLPADQRQRRRLLKLLKQSGFDGIDQAPGVLRVCPGNHECRMGLAATRDLAGLLRQRYGMNLDKWSVAVSGCANSCAQPQLAEFGILAVKSVKEEDGQRTPRFDLFRRGTDTLGSKTAGMLTETELLAILDSDIERQ